MHFLRNYKQNYCLIFIEQFPKKRLKIFSLEPSRKVLKNLRDIQIISCRDLRLNFWNCYLGNSWKFFLEIIKKKLLQQYPKHFKVKILEVSLKKKGPSLREPPEALLDESFFFRNSRIHSRKISSGMTLGDPSGISPFLFKNFCRILCVNFLMKFIGNYSKRFIEKIFKSFFERTLEVSRECLGKFFCVFYRRIALRVPSGDSPGVYSIFSSTIFTILIRTRSEFSFRIIFRRWFENSYVSSFRYILNSCSDNPSGNCLYENFSESSPGGFFIS